MLSARPLDKFRSVSERHAFSAEEKCSRLFGKQLGNECVTIALMRVLV